MKKTTAIIQRLLTALSLAALLSAAVAAQSGGVVIKGKVPVNNQPPKVTLPKAYETRLSNGLQVLVLENHKLPTFAMQMVILSGGLADPAGQEGAAQYVATMLREGTKTRSSKQIAEQVDTLGASLNATATLSSLTSAVSASGLTDQFDQIMELFADVLLNPSFPTEEFNKLKTRQLGQLRLQRAQPNFLASEMYNRVMYGAHPAARVALTAEQIQKFTPEMLKAFHAAHYKPNNAMFAIVGDVKPAEIVAKLEKTFGAWQRGDAPATNIPKAADTGAPKIYLVDRPNSAQTNLVLGALTIERTDPDYYALNLMNEIIGGGASARLFLNLREDKGYTYGAYSNVSAAKYRGVFTARTEVRSEVTKESMNELRAELKRIRTEPVPADEFARAKRTIIGSFALQLESPQSLLGNIITQKLYGLPANYWDEYPQKIAALTPADVQRVAQKYLDPAKLQVVAVGDASKIADVLKQFGTVEAYDTEGKLLKSPAPTTSTSATNSSGSNTGLAGTWKLLINSPNGEVPLTAVIKVNGAELGGSLDTPFGQFPITGGSLNGSEVKLKVKGEVQGNPIDLDLNGKLDGETMAGQITSAVMPAVEFKGKKEK